MDSSFIFGSLLDDEKGGRFQVVPQTSYTTKQRYIENSGIIVTSFFCEDGDFEVIDFAPRFSIYDRFHKPLQFFRKIKRIKGSRALKLSVIPVEITVNQNQKSLWVVTI